MQVMKPKQKFCVICGGKLYRTTAKVCSVTCSLQYNLDNPEKVKTFIQTQQAKQDKEQLKQMKFNITKLSVFESMAKKVFQHWVRLRDADLPCISCGCFHCDEWAGGHWWAAGQYSGLMFHPWNCNKQCNVHCNKFLSGNSNNYRIGLVKKIGEENVKWIEENKDRLRKQEYSREELIEITKKYKLKIKNKDFNN